MRARDVLAQAGLVHAAAEPGHEPGSRGFIEQVIQRLGMVEGDEGPSVYTAPDADPGFQEVRFYDSNKRVCVMFYQGVVFDEPLPLPVVKVKQMLKLLKDLDHVATEFAKETQHVQAVETASATKLRAALRAAGVQGVDKLAIKYAPYDYVCFMLDDGSGRLTD